MNISRDVITDLLPLYYLKECSSDTKLLVEEYFKANPDFERMAGRLAQNLLDRSVPSHMNKTDELKSLKRTRFILRTRSFLLAFAIMFTCAPLSFAYNGQFHFLMVESPMSGLVYAVIGFGFWISYFIIRRYTADL